MTLLSPNHAIRTLQVCTVLFGLSGCAVGPRYATPEPAAAPNWQESPLSVSMEPLHWNSYHDWEVPALRELLALAAADNRDLARARADLEEAVARRGLVRSALFPQVAAEGSASRQRPSENTALAQSLPPGTPAGVQNSYAAGLNASWELDLFGFNRRQVEGADARLEATAAQLDAVRLSIAAEVALAYIEWAALAEALALAEERRTLQAETYALVRTRVETGLADPLADRTARRDLRLAEAELPTLRAASAAARYRLAVLTGQSPEAFNARFTPPESLPADSPEQLPASLPAGVVRARPDVQAAERHLAAAYADLGVAEADFYPRLRITGGVGWESAGSGDLFDATSRTWLIRPAVHLPLLQGGRLRAQRGSAEARLEAARARYEQSILIALADVETVLATHLGARQSATALAEAADDARAAEAQAAHLYEVGLADLETLLTARRLRSQTDTLRLQARTEIHAQAIRYERAIARQP
ncbi:MAG: efflux transporter outer membrane subunit [Opitutales bacterium]|nr:efflux transporter outer membrane subunit [Opitutales bacterium]